MALERRGWGLRSFEDLGQTLSAEPPQSTACRDGHVPYKEAGPTMCPEELG